VLACPQLSEFARITCVFRFCLRDTTGSHDAAQMPTSLAPTTTVPTTSASVFMTSLDAAMCWLSQGEPLPTPALQSLLATAPLPRASGVSAATTDESGSTDKGGTMEGSCSHDSFTSLAEPPLTPPSVPEHTVCGSNDAVTHAATSAVAATFSVDAVWVTANDEWVFRRFFFLRLPAASLFAAFGFFSS
jgi:hypothetical protein